MRDARGSAVAALTWVLWKGRTRLQNLEATSRDFSGPTSFQIFGKHWEERLRTGSKYSELWNLFGKFWLRRPNVIVPLCGSFIFPTFISPTKDQGSATAAPMAKTTKYSYVFKIWYVSFSCTVPGVRHTYILYGIVLVYSARHVLSYILAEQYKEATRKGVFCLAPSQGSDSGETPLFVGFSNLGNIVGQL